MSVDVTQQLQFIRFDLSDFTEDEVENAIRFGESIVDFPDTGRDSSLRDLAIMNYAAWHLFTFLNVDVLLRTPDSNILSALGYSRGADTPSRRDLSQSIKSRSDSYFQTAEKIAMRTREYTTVFNAGDAV